MNYDKDFITALAHGDAGASEQLSKLPLTMRMGIAMEVDKIRQEQNIVPQNATFRVYEEKPAEDRDAEIAETIKRMMDQKRQAEEESRKRHEAYVKQQVEQAIERSRLGLPSQKQVIGLGR